MQTYQSQFIEFCLKLDILRFGEFTLKSGRKSPYFFNAGLFNTGSKLAQVGQFYASAIKASGISFDMLFGPAYKGIPLVTTTAIALAQMGMDVPYAFNRKEAKDHGEGGNIVGHALYGKVLIIDDVMTAGTAVTETMTLLKQHQVEAAGVMIAMNRQERGQGDKTAIEEIEARYGMPIFSIIKLQDLLNYVCQQPNLKSNLPALERYQEQYCIL